MHAILRFLPLFLSLLLIISLPVSGDDRSFLDTSDQFRPVYSTTLSGFVSPDNPLRIGIDVRDDMTAFARIFAYGPEGSDLGWTLAVGKGQDIMQDPDLQVSASAGDMEVITLRDRSGNYVMVEPGNYTAILSSNKTSEEATVKIVYVYHGENLDKGNIMNQTWSLKEVTIPEGLERVIFMTESVGGTDLDLFVHNSTSLPDSWDGFSFIAAKTCSDCTWSGVDNFVPEALVIDSPEPGTYVMVTRATSGNDYFFTYWMGFEEEQEKEEKTVDSSKPVSYQDVDPGKNMKEHLNPKDRSLVSDLPTG